MDTDSSDDFDNTPPEILEKAKKVTIFLFLLVKQLCAQEEYGYDESEDVSEYNEEGDEHGHPDYSKYFSVDGPAASQSHPLASFAGSEFSGFFSPQSVGPSYISHALPALSNFGESKAASRDDVERIPPRPNKPKTTSEDEAEFDDDESDKDTKQDEKNVDTEEKNDKYGLELLKYSKPFVDYNIGKSSSTISQYPLATGLSDSSSKLTPYQKYSFQPIVQASRIIPDEYVNTKPIKPFNPNYLKKNEPVNLESQSSENVPSHLKNHDCREVEGGGSEGMNCLVCTNAETNSKYTQCSYTSEKEPVEYYTGGSERYSSPAKEGHFRYRRYANKKVDPYYLIRERSRKTFDEPSIPEDYSSGFQYEPESYEQSPSEVSFSEQQSEELKKNPQNCKKVDKDGSTCTVCRNPKTGANYEQCSYTSSPQEKKYAYVKEKKYDSDDEPEESKVTTEVKPAPTADLKVENTEQKAEIKSSSKDFEPVEDYDGQIEQDTRNPKKRNNDDPIQYDTYEKNRKNSEQRFLKDKYDIPNYFAESVKHESRDKKSEDDDSKDFDEYHFKLFPELSKEESKQEDANEEYQIPESTKHNVEEVLAEFTKKDRSNCKKSEKNGMTCFLCVDQNKIQHEECMFIQESRPKSSHVAYHQLKGIKKLAEEEDEPTEETKNKPVLTEAAKPQDIVIVPSEIPSLLAAASERFEAKIPYKETKDKYKKKRSPKKYKKKSKPEVEPTLKTPTEFEVGDEEGAFSAETRPVQSKLHGVVLPKYMVEKSEFEKEFDAFSGAP
ncbi:unnamed protein product [Psylliodes chrysocephalus]|uniref:Uncharacterized protein n=1 Tax=Psylliodes chrysocephalus TaxID=3402493 RepID=A0A9P0CDE3_9CUCU|nr:unnamed protein product [Psylliodes chrysocephala]